MRARKLPTLVSLALAGAVVVGLGGCGGAGTCSTACTTAQVQNKVSTIVVIYAENHSFDNLYGLFPGANGIPGLNSTAVGTMSPQIDRTSGATLATLPQTWGGVTAAGQAPVVSQAMSANLGNAPFNIQTTYSLPQTIVTRDLYHRFFENQMQIDGGRNDKMVAWADSGGLVMGYYDGSSMQLWNLAKQYTLADNFFQAAYGGSFLNHQYLICACAPEYPNADTAAAKPTIAVLNTDSTGKYLPQLTTSASSPASAMDGPPGFSLSGNIVPKNYFGDNTFRAVNTMQPAYQPSGNAPASTDTTGLYANPAAATTLPPQTGTTIGDQLTAANVSWAWYAQAWKQVSADRSGIYNNTVPNFQAHHHPFNYYANFDPVNKAANRTAHLKDYTDLVAAAQAGTLPQVVFYKPEGDTNQHPGYASVAAGDAHIAGLVATLQASPQWNNMVIVITYDEFGGQWDHVAPPKGDLLGPGTRIPAIIISPFARKGFVDHTQYDTASVLRFISRRFGTTPLPGITARDAALMANGGVPMGDFTNALNLN